MNSSAHKQIFKSWVGISEEALIKDVATKGDETLQLCKEYWARKRKISVKDYEPIFQEVVSNYVHRLLTEKLVLKAENVLKNVQRDVSCFYFQFACETNNEELRDVIVEHLQHKHLTEAEFQDLQFYWEVLQQINAASEFCKNYKHKLNKLDLEKLLNLEDSILDSLVAELFYENRNIKFYARVKKHYLWQLLVNKQLEQEIIRWFFLLDVENSAQEIPADALEQAYVQWTITEDMYHYALKHLKNPNELIRNYFAKSAHFFPDEKLLVEKVFLRLCTTCTFQRNQQLLGKLPIARCLIERGQHQLLLRSFVSEREVEELMGQYPEHAQVLKLILTLKQLQPLERLGFQQLLQVTKSYLESCGVDFQVEQPLVTLLEFLCHETSVVALHCQLHSHPALKSVAYLQTLAQRMDTMHNHAIMLPTAYDMLHKFRNIDLSAIISKHNSGGEICSFSNAHLSQHYARRYTLNYLHFLKQQRSVYAVYYLLVDMLQKYAQITPAQLFSACQAVTELAVQQANDKSFIAHCVAFCEMLGYDSKNLRCYLRLMKRFDFADSKQPVPSHAFLCAKVERELHKQLENNEAEFPLQDYQALMNLVNAEQHSWPLLLLEWFAQQNDWWHLLILLQYFEIPVNQLRKLCSHFEQQNMGENVLRALLHEIPAGAVLTEGKRRRSFSRQHSNGRARRVDNSLRTTTSGETLTSSLGSGQDTHATLFPETNYSLQQQRFLTNTHIHLFNENAEKSTQPDIFATILLCSSHTPDERIINAQHFLEVLNNARSLSSMACNLMRACVKQRLLILSVLSATISPINHDWHWLVWLAVATDQWPQFISMANNHLQEGVAWSWRLIERAVALGCTKQLLRGIQIFYKEHPLQHLFQFLQSTANELNFNEAAVEQLRHYLLALSNNEVEFPLCSTLTNEQLMQRSIKLMLLHLQHNFATTVQQKNFTYCICRSGLGDISSLVDFCRLHAVFSILLNNQDKQLQPQHLQLSFEKLLQRDNQFYDELLAQLLELKAFDCAVRLATLLQLPSCPDLIYQKWVTNSEHLLSGDALPVAATFLQYEQEIASYSLQPSMLVHFLLQIGKRLDDAEDECNLRRRYRLLKQALSVIKRHHLFPNECFDRDQIEYDMTYAYLRIDITKEEEEIYHSEYFEQIMLKERCVLYKSFLELKELAGIEDLNVQTERVALSSVESTRLKTLLNLLLDKGDIVEALRLQELFDYRPMDLRFLVFCMALAEGVTTIFSLSPAERKYLSGIEKSAFVRFNKRTLDNIQLEQRGSPGKQSMSSMDQLSDSCCSSTYEFEEVPAKEKRQTLDAIQGMVSKLNAGLRLGKRILMAYRSAMYLDKEYLDVLRTKDINILLKSVAAEDCVQRLLVVNDILTSTCMTDEEIAMLLAYEIMTAVVRPRFYIFNRDQETKQLSKTFTNAYVWGHNIDRDLHLFFELTTNTTKLGYCLLQFCDALTAYRKYQDGKPYEHTVIFAKLVEIIKKYGVPSTSTSLDESNNAAKIDASTPPPQVLSHKKQNLIYVELLIKAHQCFVHECSMEGIACILHRCKSLTSVLAKGKAWSFIVRLLTGIARYREMFYCFDALIANDQFESLLGLYDEDKSISLRQGIFAYLREYTPENAQEYRKLAALRFLMYKELAEMWEQDARNMLDKILANNLITQTKAANSIKKLKVTSEVLTLLEETMKYYTHAAENALQDNKFIMAQKYAASAELVAVQIHLASQVLPSTTASDERLPGSCICVINVHSREECRELINSHLSVPQSIIVGRAYGYDINWAEALLTQYVLMMNSNYLNDFLLHMEVSDAIIENVVKNFQLHAEQQNITPQMEQHLANLVECVQSVTLKYKLASVLALKSSLISLINGPSMYYLKDTNYGAKENHSLANT